MEKIDLNLSNMILEVQPELAEVVLKHKLSKQYMCWLIIKELDKNISGGGGKIGVKKVIPYLCEITQKTRFTISRYLQKGDTIFWRFNKFKDVLYLNSFSNICLSLGLSHVYSYNILYDTNQIHEEFERSSDFLLAAVAAKTGKPVSNISLAERCGVCKSTVKNYLNRTESEKINICRRMINLELITVYQNYEDAKIGKEEYLKIHPLDVNKMKTRWYNDNYALFKQLPNSVINKTGRSPVKHQKKSLREKSGYIMIEKHNKIYYDKDTESSGLEAIGAFLDRGNKLVHDEMPNVRVYVRRNR